MHKKIIFCLIAAVILTACSPKADIFIQDSGDAVITVDVKASSLLESLVENAAGFSEGEKKRKQVRFQYRRNQGRAGKQAYSGFVDGNAGRSGNKNQTENFNR